MGLAAAIAFADVEGNWAAADAAAAGLGQLMQPPPVLAS